MIINKVCSKCKLEKSLGDFHKDKTSPNGYTYYCKACSREKCQNAAHKYRETRKKYSANKERKAVRNSQERQKRQTNPIFNTKCRVRTRLNNAFKGRGFTKGKSEDLIGCSYQELKYYIEAKFQAGMSWYNLGEWHIDHIIPLASAKNKTELEALCHYTNLQPLWAADNIKKGKSFTVQTPVKELNK